MDEHRLSIRDGIADVAVMNAFVGPATQSVIIAIVAKSTGVGR
jgi:hypothetical protein